MATLTVTESTDFRGGLAELNITDIVFDTAALATAEFTPSQFGAGLIANNVEITGDDQANIIQIEYAAQGEFFSAAGWQFQDWDPETDVVHIVGIAGGDDTIIGSSQNDLIVGGGGLDEIDAGGGNDTIWVGSVFAPGTVFDGGSEFAGGVDQITLLGLGAFDLRPTNIVDMEQLSFFFDGQTAIVDGDQVGGGGFTTIRGASGGTSSLTVIDSTVDLSDVTFLSWGADDTITITGTNAVSNELIGSSQADAISGNGASVDYITGGDGADALIGGGGFDTFRYHSGGEVEAGEVISGGSDYDTIRLENAGSINFSNATISDVENLTFAVGCVATLDADQIGGGEIGTVSGSIGFDALVVNAVGQAASLVGVSFNAAWDATDAITINGSGLQDSLSGSTRNDTINGMGGNDLMGGGLGDDTYIVDHANDTIAENVGGGTDLVRSSVSFVLDPSEEIEDLILTGVAAIDGTGNGLANVITGNSAANVLSGGGEDDTLTGYGGNDRLDGGAGEDAMAGGNGNDTYVVDDTGDTASEASGSGVDVVQSTVTFTLAAGIENLVLNGADPINGTGNGSVNTISGNSAANVLSGAGGNDTLTSFGGNDWLEGGAGADAMTGGNGNDTYVVDNLGDTTVEGGGGGTDLVHSTVTVTLSAQVENLVLTGGSAINGTGNASANTMSGNAAANRLDGNGGADTIAGFGGADTFVFDDGDGADVVTDFQNGSDVCDLTAVAGVDEFSDLVLTDTGAGVDVDYGTGSFELANIDIATVGASDFIFA